MAEATGPHVFTIPPHVAFVDALAKGLLARTAGDPMRLARGLVLLPNRRAVRALTDAFVRQSEGRALLLPRMTPIGDVDEDEALGTFADDLEIESALAPAVDSTERRLLLTQIVRDWSPGLGAVEAMRLADALARTLDGLRRDGQDADALLALPPDELAEHWQVSLKFLALLVGRWPAKLAEIGKADQVDRVNALIAALTRRWRSDTAPDRLIVAAGFVDTAPGVAALIGAVARLPDGLVVLPGLDIDMAPERWAAIRCHLDEPDAHPRGNSEGHPQFAFRCLLARMKVGRGEVETWPSAGLADGPAARTQAVARAMAPAHFTDDWASGLAPETLSGVRFLEAATSGEEAQAIALALRGQLETPGRTAALVTPDRALARRVAAHLGRYGVPIDDSAGVPLGLSPPGTFLLSLLGAAAQGFAPTPLLAALKHPLVRSGDADDRLAWLDRVRTLDLALRGVRPRPGLSGVALKITESLAAKRIRDTGLAEWWAELSATLAPLETLLAAPVAMIALVETLRQAGEVLTGEELWRGAAGRALSDLVETLGSHGRALEPVGPADSPGLLAAVLSDVAVRAPGRHPRLAIYGLIEARLQRADLMILGGLNEGVWPSLPSPDPWLAPSARVALGLPGLDRRIGQAAHDFVQAMGAPQVLLTRARRDDSAPAVPSRFWLRLAALAGADVESDGALVGIARALDRTDQPRPAPRPAPAPAAARRPRTLSVTQVEKLKADPYSFYADRMLRLRRLDALDEDPTAAERGTFVHAILERWMAETKGDVDALPAMAAEALRVWDAHPLMRALWVPRVKRMVGWVADEMTRWAGAGWRPALAEVQGGADLGPIRLTGRADRIDRDADGALAIIDYKTGGTPSRAQLEGGFAPQLGLLAWLAGQGAFGPRAPVAALRYWKLSGGRVEGKASDPLTYGRTAWIDLDAFTARCLRELGTLTDDLLLGDAPFKAKAHPEHAMRYTDHDQVARVAEWWGREPS